MQRFLEFHNLVNKYQSDKGTKGLTTWSQFIAMLFCQLTGADSLREISDGLYSSLGKLSHIGATAVCRSTLSYANSKRPYKLYEDFYYVLLEKFRHEIQGRLGKLISLKYANGLRNGANSDTHRCKQLTEHGEERCIKLREVAGFSAVRTIFQIVGPRKILHCLLGK